VTQELETLLFNLLILGEITDDRGRVWRRNPYDLYILEITDPLPKVCDYEYIQLCSIHMANLFVRIVIQNIFVATLSV